MTGLIWRAIIILISSIMNVWDVECGRVCDSLIHSSGNELMSELNKPK